MYTEYDYNASLCHHGVKGMHWGVRRYQNEDGTRTALGKRRSAKVSNETIREARTAAAFKAYREYKLTNSSRQDLDYNLFAYEKACNDADISYKKLANEIMSSEPISQKMKHNKKTYYLAAQHIANNKMSVEDALNTAKNTH